MKFYLLAFWGMCVPWIHERQIGHWYNTGEFKVEISTVHDSWPVKGIGRVKPTLCLLKYAVSGTCGSLTLHLGSNSLSSTHQSLRKRLRLELMCAWLKSPSWAQSCHSGWVLARWEREAVSHPLQWTLRFPGNKHFNQILFPEVNFHLIRSQRIRVWFITQERWQS